jgi:hypothetical protein
MSWNNVIPAELLLGIAELKPKVVENPEVSMPEELVTDCLIRYKFEGSYDVVAAHADHPCFAELRRVLKGRGYIKIPEYPCWNGDRVLKRFRFNGFQLEPGDTFYCAGAWAVKIKVRNRKDETNDN